MSPVIVRHLDGTIKLGNLSYWPGGKFHNLETRAERVEISTWRVGRKHCEQTDVLFCVLNVVTYSNVKWNIILRETEEQTIALHGRAGRTEPERWN